MKWKWVNYEYSQCFGIINKKLLNSVAGKMRSHFHKNTSSVMNVTKWWSTKWISKASTTFVTILSHLYLKFCHIPFSNEVFDFWLHNYCAIILETHIIHNPMNQNKIGWGTCKNYSRMYWRFGNFCNILYSIYSLSFNTLLKFNAPLRQIFFYLLSVHVLLPTRSRISNNLYFNNAKINTLPILSRINIF